jgi:selenocysteine-specific elongation factor
MPAPALVLGTAGHIDHGKSSLVKALTGTDPDRLPEEQERGVTIELGFARLELPSGRSMGVVDVPGHERFVRQMVAGATGMDVVLLVVAADDGVMPQTREHLAIIDLLGIPKGVVALTKTDLVDPDWIALVREDVTRLLVGTSIEGAPIVEVSSRTGEGLDALREALDNVAGEAQARQAALPMRLPVDRVFTVSGAGTVVTGTMWSGTARRDDPVEILPSGRAGRIRGVQVHSRSMEQATAGQRVALNLAGVDKDGVARGDIVAAPGSLVVTDRFDGRFAYLAGNDRPFESGSRVHVHHGTREVLGRVLLMDAAQLAPGESSFVQIRLEEPLAPRYDDRFIVRSYSPMFTIGGGVVLDALPPRHSRLSDAERRLLTALLAHDLSSAALDLLASRGVPMTSAEVASALGVPRQGVQEDLDRADLVRLKVGAETYVVMAAELDRLLAAIEASIVQFHERNPKATGVSANALRDLVDRRIPGKVFDAVLDAAAKRGIVRVTGGSVRHPQAAGAALEEEDTALDRLVPLLEADGLATGTVGDLAVRAGVDPGVARKALGKLVSMGRVVRLGPELHFASSAVEGARERIVSYLEANGSMLAKDARDILGTSRKYVVPLLEYFDSRGVTRREGDARVLRKG